jgi:hypothetical protein
VNSLILYRGSIFAKDELTRLENNSYMTNSLSYGTSPFAGSLYDRGATFFHYARKKNSDAVAFIVSLKEFTERKTIFHAYNVHPLIQLMSRGEYFHARTKIWKLNPQETITGFLGRAKYEYQTVKDSCKTEMPKEEVEKAFEKYKNSAYMLAEAII